MTTHDHGTRPPATVEEWRQLRGPALVEAMRNATWHVHPSDIGGWSIMPIDQPPESGAPEVGTFIAQELAEDIAADHARPYDSRPDTLMHSLRVGGLVIELVTAMLGRATTHDLTKTQPPEVEGFNRAKWRLSTMAYDSPEYAASRADLSDTLAHHYQHNRHHPEHFGPAGVAGMTLVDLVEMLADWKAASERMRTGTGSIINSILINRDRFGLSEQLTQILINTVVAAGWATAAEADGQS